MTVGIRLMTVRQGWAVIRVDSADVDVRQAEELAHRIYVKEVLLDPTIAEAEVSRLNQLNRDKGVHYFVQVTRLRDREDNVLGG